MSRIYDTFWECYSLFFLFFWIPEFLLSYVFSCFPMFTLFSLFSYGLLTPSSVVQESTPTRRCSRQAWVSCGVLTSTLSHNSLCGTYGGAQLRSASVVTCSQLTFFTLEQVQVNERRWEMWQGDLLVRSVMMSVQEIRKTKCCKIVELINSCKLKI